VVIEWEIEVEFGVMVAGIVIEQRQSLDGGDIIEIE
jgi:hypothetical protein